VKHVVLNSQRPHSSAAHAPPWRAVSACCCRASCQMPAGVRSNPSRPGHDVVSPFTLHWRHEADGTRWRLASVAKTARSC